jgi:hypothetical protein
MSDDITHNLTVVREALEAEGLSVHVKLIDAAIEDSAGLLAQIAACNTLLDRQAQMLKHAPAAAVIERIAAANSAEPETDDLTVPLAIQLSQTEHQLTSARKALTEIAALSHRWKWEFDLSEDYKPTAAAARGLITKSFDALHRLGDQALKSRDSLTGENRDSK